MKKSTFIGCCLIHLVIGSVYAESILYNDIIKSTGWPEWVPKLGFCLQILFLSIFSVAIRFFERNSEEERIIWFGGLGYIMSLTLSYVAIYQAENFVIKMSWIPYLAACVILGCNIGSLYSITISRVSQAEKYAGLLSGIVVLCFAAGSMIAAKAYEYFLRQGIETLVNYCFIIFPVLIFGTFLYRQDEPVQVTDIRNTFSNRQWQLLFLIFFLNIMIGLILLSDMVNLSQENGLDIDTAISLVGATGIANGAGRLFWPAISDIISPKKAFLICLIIQCCALIMLSQYWYFCTLIITTCYGAGFALVPLICRETWKENAPVYYSSILLAWGLSAIMISFIPANINIMLGLCLTAIILMIKVVLD